MNNLERVLATRDHTFLFLDEAHLARPEDIIAAIFMISEGQGRGRYNEISRWEWFVPILSTSNVESVAGGRGALAELRHQLDCKGLIKKAGGGQAGDRFATKVKVGSTRVYLLSFDSSVFD